MQSITSPLRYPGGKSKALKYILPYCLPNFSEYREPFLGGGSVFLALKQLYPIKKYHINDLNYDLICFWKQLKKNPEKLVTKITDIKNEYANGRELYEYLLDIEDFTNDFIRAVRFYILNRITYSGTVDSGGYSKQAFEKRFTTSRIADLTNVSKLLIDVKITCEDYSNSLFQEGHNVFLFLDPPYVNSIKSKLYGRQGDLHKSFDHKVFVNKVKKSPYYWLITLDDTEEMKNKFKSSNIYPWKMQYGMDNQNGKKPTIGSELIITNYLKFKLTPVNAKKKSNNSKIYNNIINNFLRDNSNISILNIPQKNVYYIKNKLLNTIQERGLRASLNIEIIRKKIYLEKKINTYVE